MISAIVAYDEGGVMGKDGGLPWKIPDDLKHFKRTTLGHPVVMGHTTYKSLGKPLPGRRNLVLSKTVKELPGAEVFGSLEEALASCRDPFIIGGAQVYRQALLDRLIDRLVVSRVYGRHEGDVLFPVNLMGHFGEPVLVDRYHQFEVLEYRR